MPPSSPHGRRWRGLTLLRLAIPLLVLLAPALIAQEVRGRVLDRASGQPLADATVTLQAPGGSVVQRVSTNRKGEYRLRAPRAGEYALLFRRVGFQPVATTAFALGASETLPFDVALSATTTQLDTIVVRGKRDGVTPGADYYNRHKALGRGIFLSRLDVLSQETQYVSEVLENVKALRHMPSSQCLDIFIDGRPLPRRPQAIGTPDAPHFAPPAAASDVPTEQPRPTYVPEPEFESLGLDQILLPREIAGIEIYARSSLVPAEWRSLLKTGRFGRPCALIMIWTRAAW